jgi:FixJ family two-component response regulator
MSGGELVKRALKADPGLKVIVVSGYADLPEGEALELPRLAKPFDEAELAQAVAAVVK